MRFIMVRRLRTIAIGAAVASFLLLQARAGTAATEKVIYSFVNQNGGGYYPFTGVVVGPDGTLYGTTYFGGASPGLFYHCGYPGCGAAYSLTPPAVPGGAWTAITIASFTANTDSAYLSGLTLSPSGTLFGTTQRSEILPDANGQPSGDNTGEVFELTPPANAGGPWTLSFPYFFVGGLYPNALVIASDSRLYGTGASGGGGVFGLIPPAAPTGSWTESSLKSFAGPPDDGAIYTSYVKNASTLLEDLPTTGGLLVRTGVLYGVTVRGGVNDAGTVFQMIPPKTGNSHWTETILYSFTGGDDGENPNGNLIADKNGVLYGAARGGATGLGVVFSLTPPSVAGEPWTESVLHNFSGTPDGSYPQPGLVMKGGKIYGATNLGGNDSGCLAHTKYGCGTVFELTPPVNPGDPWSESLLHSFAGVNGDGSFPYAGPVAGPDGKLYGTTFSGGKGGIGTVYQITP
jgi:uncharacterized repeat protein (TIGR03803 family)